jgi:hypothetical protein
MLYANVLLLALLFFLNYLASGGEIKILLVLVSCDGLYTCSN